MRILHTMLRVGNLERSINFYTKLLGMKLIRQNDYPEGKFTLAFIGYGEESQETVLELTYNWGIDSYKWAPLLDISHLKSMTSTRPQAVLESWEVLFPEMRGR